MMKQTSTFAKVFSWGFALLWLVVCLLPFTQLISVTFSTADRGIVSTFYPNSLASGIEKIKQALIQTNMIPSTVQTLLYVSATIVGMLLVSSLAAYELACFKFPGRDVIFMLILSSMMLPMITYIIPLYRFVYNLGWSDTLIGLAIPSIPSAFAVFIIKQFLERMPHELWPIWKRFWTRTCGRCRRRTFRRCGVSGPWWCLSRRGARPPTRWRRWKR